ncbi:sister chromatid cohesion protein PDS5 [Isosphaeraceae bacterium EP7]
MPRNTFGHIAPHPPARLIQFDATQGSRRGRFMAASPVTPPASTAKGPRSREQFMSSSSDVASISRADGPRKGRRARQGVRTLVVLVACCGAVLWAWRHLSENNDPVLIEARAIQKQAIGALQSGEPTERVTAIVALERLNAGDSSVAIHPLIAALEDHVSDVRLAAVEALGSIGSSLAESGSGRESLRDAVTSLIRRLEDSDPAVRLATVNALGSVGSCALKSKSRSGDEIVQPAATALIRRLGDSNPDVRSRTATNLGLITSPRFVIGATPLIDRKAVIHALIGRLDDPDSGVRLAVIQAISSLPDENGDPHRELAESLKDQESKIRRAAVSGLSPYRQGLDPWVPILLRLAENDPDPSMRDHCLTMLSFAFKSPAVTPNVIPVLMPSLKSADAKVRSQVVRLLGEFKAYSAGAIPELVRILNEPFDPQSAPYRGPFNNLEPASEAASALGQIAPRTAKAKEVIAALIEVVRSGPISRRGWAAVALGQFGPAAEEAVPALIGLLEDSSHANSFERQESAAMALGMIAPGKPSSDRAIAALRPVLQSGNWNSCLRAVEALGLFGPKAAAAIPAIREMKTHRSGAVKNAAANALLSIEDESTP